MEMTESILYNKNLQEKGPIPLTAELERSVQKTLAYFDIFSYPLNAGEIKNFLEIAVPAGNLNVLLQKMVSEKRIFYYESFYSLHDNPLLAKKRLEDNSRAEPMIEKAQRTGRFLFQFPFVRAVGISGSLSKNVAEHKADFDFFIITKANRLWIARTLMHLYKKFTFLTGRQHHYCMNYYMDEEALLLQDQNIFTAMELKTLLPVAGTDAMQKLFDVNTWVNQYLPACDYRVQSKPDKKPSLWKLFGEWIFKASFGAKMDTFFFDTTTKRWQRKKEKGKKNNKGQMMGLITGKHFARSNPGALQERILSLYNKKITEIL
jgi:hypothetical protein